MAPISFHLSRTERELIHKIVLRAALLSGEYGLEQPDRMALEMDLTAAHANGCPLRLDALLEASVLSFFHDIAGITAHIDRTTGRLSRHFLPRHAATPDSFKPQ